MFKQFLVILTFFSIVNCSGQKDSSSIKSRELIQAEARQPLKRELPPIVMGAERMHLYLPLISGKRVGIVTNQTGVIRQKHLVDSLVELGVNITNIFSPEHGFRGNADAGERINSSIDDKTKIAIISLYGNHKKPTKEDFKNVDVLLFDIQDVGVRFYTYISTLHYVMEACAENNLPLIVLDRPNPNGHIVDGPVLDIKYKSFVGMHAVPILHGMTIGEYALMINGENWLPNNLQCNLTIVRMQNYIHNRFYHLPIAPSPNLRTDNAIKQYASLCLLEPTKISVGRGTETPFEVYGSPALPDTLFSFKPISSYGSKNPKFENEVCYGFDLRNDERNFKEFNLEYLINISKQFKLQSEWISDPAFFDKLAGTSELRQQLQDGSNELIIRKSWQEDLENYRQIRNKYLQYSE